VPVHTALVLGSFRRLRSSGDLSVDSGGEKRSRSPVNMPLHSSIMLDGDYYQYQSPWVAMASHESLSAMLRASLDLQHQRGRRVPRYAPPIALLAT
jgi:hypothetical protein